MALAGTAAGTTTGLNSVSVIVPSAIEADPPFAAPVATAAEPEVDTSVAASAGTAQAVSVKTIAAARNLRFAHEKARRRDRFSMIH